MLLLLLFTANAAWTVAVVVVNVIVKVVVVSICQKCLPFFPCSNSSPNIHALPEQVYLLP